MVRGAAHGTSVIEKRVVVLDDPVSSLDAEVLYLVSTLVRKLCDEIWQDQGSVEQLLLFTHSIHFLKEVEFRTQRQRRAGAHPRPRKFWTVSKGDAGSVLQPNLDVCPVSTTYELLWQQTRNADANSIGTQNAMRRILENYFKLLGGMDADAVVNTFSGPKHSVARAPFSWVNEGSHNAFDELSFPRSRATLDMFKNVFRDVFEECGRKAHCDMMMDQL